MRLGRLCKRQFEREVVQVGTERLGWTRGHLEILEEIGKQANLTHMPTD